MLDDDPVLKERLMGLSAVCAIAVGGFAAVDLMVTGGFDFGAQRAPYERGTPSAQVTLVDATRYARDSIHLISSAMGSTDWLDAVPFDEAEAARLEGDDDGSPPPDAFEATDEDALYREIEALYAREGILTSAPEVTEAQYEDAPAIDAYMLETEPVADESEKEDPSVSETESPW